jgi:hypothetical protein
MKPTWESLPYFHFEWLHEKVAEIKTAKLVDKYPGNHLTCDESILNFGDLTYEQIS